MSATIKALSFVWVQLKNLVGVMLFLTCIGLMLPYLLFCWIDEKLDSEKERY